MPHRRVSRSQLIAAFHTGLEGEPDVLAAWLGGSDASGRTDEYSDIDLQVIVPDEKVEATFETIHRIVTRLSPIAHRYRFPEPTWHGHSQELLQLRDADPNHFLDLVVMKQSLPDRLLERERHGKPLVLFDRAGLLQPPPLDWTAHLEKMEARMREIRARFPLLQPLVTRGVHRRQPVESAYGYQVLTLKPLIDLLRLRYCPERFDFGPRYLDRDLPAEWQTEIERLAYPGSPEVLLACQATAARHFNEQLAAFDRGEWDLRRAAR